MYYIQPIFTPQGNWNIPLLGQWKLLKIDHVNNSYVCLWSSDIGLYAKAWKSSQKKYLQVDLVKSSIHILNQFGHDMFSSWYLINMKHVKTFWLHHIYTEFNNSWNKWGHRWLKNNTQHI
jgi:hypothetical protein